MSTTLVVGCGDAYRASRIRWYPPVVSCPATRDHRSKAFTVTRIGLERPACPRCILTHQLFPVGGQELFRRRAAVLVASLNDNCPFGREGGSHRAITHGVKDIERSEARCRVRGKTVSRRRIADN